MALSAYLRPKLLPVRSYCCAPRKRGRVRRGKEGQTDLFSACGNKIHFCVRKNTGARKHQIKGINTIKSQPSKLRALFGREQNGGDSNAATLSPRGNERKCWAIHRQKKALQHHQMKNNNVPDWQYQFWVQGASRYSGKLHAKKHYYRKLAGERSYPKQGTPTKKSRRYRPEAIVFGACTTPLAFETGDAKREKN